MIISRPLRLDKISLPLLNHLDSRDAAVWVMPSFVTDGGGGAVAEVLRLPWRFVLSESSDATLLTALEQPENAAEFLVRRRGLLHLVDTNPADVLLPPRSLPVYLLNGRDITSSASIAAITRRLTMLEVLRRSQVKELIILSGSQAALPAELSELWRDGLRTIVTVVSDKAEMETELQEWRKRQSTDATAAFLPFSANNFCQALLSAYRDSYPADNVLLRLRDVRGDIRTLDITQLDDPDYPILRSYELLQERDLRRLQADDLTVEDVEGFFGDASTSWRPYAAGMPWIRDQSSWNKVKGELHRLDRSGPAANRVLYISSESGAGGTTLLRSISWFAAEEGYPVLIARPAPFAPKALEVATFITRVLSSARTTAQEALGKERHYETPWLLVFDQAHWEGRETELRHFVREMERNGRAACVLVVTGPYTPLEFYETDHFVSVANLSHDISIDDALALGRHLNQFLTTYGPVRTETEWRNFYEESAIQARRGIAAFWIALSFWLQRQFDMRETVQGWIYRQFKERIKDKEVRRAILDIAALSTERLPLPETMLPPTTDWPVTQKIENVRREVPALGLARIVRDGDRYWAMAHDIIGRYLLTALYYDSQARDAEGFGDAQNPEHLRFQALRRISREPALGYVVNKAIAEEFAMSIFKVDPDHGHATLVPFWREVLEALDEMPKTLRSTSRFFLHHTAISRRRIAKQTDTFSLQASERVKLLERAINDIRYALENVPATTDGESDLNLYNSLALAYQDLADEIAKEGGEPSYISALRVKAQEATQRAYRISPDNSFVIETYARSLLVDARASTTEWVEKAIEVLNIVYAAMERDRSGQRRFNLGKLADQAMELLLQRATSREVGRAPNNEIEALENAIHALAFNVTRSEDMELSDFPQENRVRADALLGHALLQANPQAVRLRYALRCLDVPNDFRGQLELLQSLQGGGTVFTPQMRLELAVLLQQCDRHYDAARLFRELREVWREGEHYVQVPERLRWLKTQDGTALRQVRGVVTFTGAHRWVAKIHELQNAEVLFRPQEYGKSEFAQGAIIHGYISFGHNGPFLRPTTAISS